MSDASNSEKSLDEVFRGYVWDYFALHADHRLRAFHFYILLSTALLGGFALSVKNGGLYKWMATFGVLLVFFSFVFWKMDDRTRQLVKNGENALKFLDAQHALTDQESLPHALRLFSREEASSSKLKPYPLISGHFSYARCFRWVFSTFSIVGLSLAAASIVAGHA
jgi:hypothetical protein